MMTALARARIGLGLAAFAAPGLSMRVTGISRGTDTGRDLMVRLYAAREIALGAGYLLSGEEAARRQWARIGLAVDALDAFSALRTRSRLPLWVTAGVVGIAGTAAGLGAAKAAHDVLG
ncbi:hypothetical protein D0T12_12955 [Actinomadura spongiicola]|uniref:Uncharacterized protein n=2 Tax=Actinomadura spongiicola TaxID=2303421 RepID=A0A372GHB8_9ACTN|nr:hypothetical protein D0T12_12955 [Actinomadura spongiicola]